MDVGRIVSELDAEIAHLQQIRSALVGGGGSVAAATGKKRGRPKGSKSIQIQPKRTMSAVGRAKIAAAQKARWAAQKKAATKEATKALAKAPAKKKTSAKKTAVKEV